MGLFEKWFEDNKETANTETVIKAKKSEPKPGDFRIIQMNDGKWFPQMFGSMWGNPRNWLTVGRVGESLPYSCWVFTDEKFSQKSESECLKVIADYKNHISYRDSDASSIKKEILL